ncbi:MAG TPA: hypothetical protein PLI51_05990 [bacterium]|nr:hypothetical protein [bacterium]HPQ66260.1 hypothetical protein [bacterium]
MAWIRRNNPEIDAERLEREILEEVRRRGWEEPPETGEGTAEGAERGYLLSLLDHYAEPGRDELLSGRSGAAGRALRPLLKLWGRLQRNQRIFNLLVVEILRSQEEERRGRDEAGRD